MDLRKCRKCLEEKPLDDFYLAPSRKGDGVHPWCKPCTRAYNRDYVRRNPEGNSKRAQRSRIKRKYGITWQEREQMIAKQSGCCAICGEPFESTKTTHTDHSHETGAIREILCWPCNCGLGNFRDDPALLRAAAEYLEKHQVTSG